MSCCASFVASGLSMSLKITLYNSRLDLTGIFLLVKLLWVLQYNIAKSTLSS